MKTVFPFVERLALSFLRISLDLVLLWIGATFTWSSSDARCSRGLATRALQHWRERMDASKVSQEHVALARSLFELQNHRQSDPAWLEKCVAAFAADCEVVSACGITLRGPEGYKRFLRFFLVESFPDLRTELTHVFATEDQVVLEGIFRGTTTGSRTLPTGALKASGRPGEGRCCFVLQIRHGKITSLHSYYDLTTLLEQLDLKSTTAQAT